MTRRPSRPPPPSPRWRARSFSVGLGLVVAFVATYAAAQLSMRRIGVQWREKVPHISFSARDLANNEVRDSLESGLQKRLLVTLQAYRDGRASPFLTLPRTCSVTYDLWDESYLVRVGRATERHPTLETVLERCLVLRGVAFGSAAQWEGRTGQDVYFAVRAEFNPISRSRCRALLRPSGSEGPVGPVVVNIVRREICSAERAIDFRSPTARVP